VHAAILALINGDQVDRECWRTLLDDLRSGRLEDKQSVALLTALAAGTPAPATLAELLVSLDEGRPPGPPPVRGAVNVVGTGGGPPTCNLSTAAAFVASAAGVPVVKSGSRAYTSVCGSIDLLEELGVALCRSDAEARARLELDGIAFVGAYVYPSEFTRLARNILPIGMRSFGRILNLLGPFLARVPAAAQVTGVSDPRTLPTMRALGRAVADREIWLVHNDAGIDELVGFATNVVEPSPQRVLSPVTIRPGDLAAAGGSAADLAPVGREVRVDHFRAIVAGQLNETTAVAVALGAASMMIAGGHETDWRSAVDRATRAMTNGTACQLVGHVRTPRRRPALTGGANARG
jgi:anthranilate phosphoribosyltransferase